MTTVREEAVPPRSRGRDGFAPALLALSLLLHAAGLVLLLRAPQAAAARPPAEIPVEVVQQMPAQTPEPPAPKAAKPAPKPEAPDKPERAARQTGKAAPRSSKAAAASPNHPEPRRAGTPDAPGQGVAARMQQLLGPMPAAVMPSVASGDNPFDDGLSYKQMVLSKVARQRREDRHNGIPGHVVVAFTIGDAGEVVSCAVREKSVDPNLDAEAVAMVYRGAPYPPPPADAPRAFSFGLAFRPT